MADLKTTFTGDASGFTSTLSKMERNANSFSSSMTRKIGGALAGIGIGAAIKGFVSELDNIGDSADKLGVTTEFFQEIDQAAKKSGSSAEQVARAVQKLAINLIDMKPGDDTDKALKQLGLDSNQLLALPLEDRFKKVAAAIAATKDPATKLALANQLLGKSGKGLLPVLEELGKQSIDVIPDSTIRNVQKFNDMITTLTQNITSNLVKGIEIARDVLLFDLDALRDPTQKKKKAEDKAERDKKQKEAEDALKAKKKLEEAEAKAETEKGVEKAVKKLDQETELQEMKNAGLEKEAEIKRKIAEVEEKAKVPLDAQQKQRIANAAAREWEAKNNQITEGRALGLSKVGVTTAVQMGAILDVKAGSRKVDGGAAALDKERNKMLSDMTKYAYTSGQYESQYFSSSLALAKNTNDALEQIGGVASKINENLMRVNLSFQE